MQPQSSVISFSVPHSFLVPACEAALYKTVLVVIKMSGLPIIEVKMNLLLMFEDAAFFFSLWSFT